MALPADGWIFGDGLAADTGRGRPHDSPRAGKQPERTPSAVAAVSRRRAAKSMARRDQPGRPGPFLGHLRHEIDILSREIVNFGSRLH